jgi:hypothetical protein
MTLDPIIGFFIIGILATLFGSNIKLPSAISDFISFFLLITIGLKGGIELSKENPTEILAQIFLIASIGLILPLLAYPILKKWGGFTKFNAASIAAHYGSVSIGTYAVALAYLESINVSYEAHTPLFVVILEIPAILVGILLAKGRSLGKNWKALLHEVFANKSVVLLFAGLLLGWVCDPVGLEKIKPLFFDLFSGVLCLFLLEMGIVAATEVHAIKRHGVFLVGFGIAMPIVAGTLGVSFGWLAGLSIGGTTLVGVLAGSASYIAAPAAMRMSVPEANPAIPLGASLGVTFPFNVMIGIPIYYNMAQFIHG